MNWVEFIASLRIGGNGQRRFLASKETKDERRPFLSLLVVLHLQQPTSTTSTTLVHATLTLMSFYYLTMWRHFSNVMAPLLTWSRDRPRIISCNIATYVIYSIQLREASRIFSSWPPFAFRIPHPSSDFFFNKKNFFSPILSSWRNENRPMDRADRSSQRR